VSSTPYTFSGVTLAGPLWTVADLKALQLRITDTAHDADVAQKIDAAQDYVLGYLGPAGDPTWTPTTAPARVRHAVAMLATYLYEHRGDDPANVDGNVWAVLRELLGQRRDPAIG